MHITSSDSANSQLRVHFSTSEHPNEQAQVASKESNREEAAVKELNQQEAKVEKSEQTRLDLGQQNSKASHAEGQQQSKVGDVNSKEAHSPDSEKIPEQFSKEKEEKQHFFNSSGQLAGKDNQSNVIDVLG